MLQVFINWHPKNLFSKADVNRAFSKWIDQADMLEILVKGFPKNVFESTEIQRAMDHYDLEIIALLLKYFSPTYFDITKTVFKAIDLRDTDMLELLLKHFSTSRFDLNEVKRAISSAITHLDVPLMQVLLNHFPLAVFDVNDLNRAFSIASESSSIAMLQLLFNWFSIEIFDNAMVNRSFTRAICRYTLDPNTGVIKLLLEQFPRGIIDKSLIFKALKESIEYWDVAIIKVLLLRLPTNMVEFVNNFQQFMQAIDRYQGFIEAIKNSSVDVVQSMYDITMLMGVFSKAIDDWNTELMISLIEAMPQNFFDPIEIKRIFRKSIRRESFGMLEVLFKKTDWMVISKEDLAVIFQSNIKQERILTMLLNHFDSSYFDPVDIIEVFQRASQGMRGATIETLLSHFDSAMFPREDLQGVFRSALKENRCDIIALLLDHFDTKLFPWEDIKRGFRDSTDATMMHLLLDHYPFEDLYDSNLCSFGAIYYMKIYYLDQ